MNDIVDALEESDYDDDSDLDKDYEAESSDEDDEDFPMPRPTKRNAIVADAGDDNDNVAGPSKRPAKVVRDRDIFQLRRPAAGEVLVYMDPPEEQKDAITDIDSGKEGCLKKIWK